MSKPKIGIGSSSIVYEGTYNGERVALKYGNITENEIYYQTLASRDNLAPKIYDYNDNVIVMEYIEGPSFRDLIISNNQHVIELYFNIIYHTIYLNQEVGILHGDLHSENILISDRIVFIDYGSAKTYHKRTHLPLDFHDLYTVSLSIIKEKSLLRSEVRAFAERIQDYHLDTSIGWYNIYNSFYEIHHELPNADEVVDILRELIFDT